MRTILVLTGFLRQFKWRVTSAILLGTGTILAGVGLLASSGYLVSSAALRPPILDLMVVIVAVRFFGISRAVLRYGERLLSHDITFRVLLTFRSLFFRVISDLPASRLSGFRSGLLLSSITSDIDELQNYYIRVFTPVVVAILSSIITFIFLSRYSPAAAGITLALLAVNGGLVPIILRRLVRGLGSRQVSLRSRLYHLWIEQIQGLHEIRIFGLQNTYKKQASELSSEIAHLERSQSFVTGLQDSLHTWMMFASVTVSLVVTAPLVLGGELSGIMLALVIFTAMASFEATQNIGTAFQYLESTEKAAKNLFLLSATESTAPGQTSEAAYESEDENDFTNWNPRTARINLISNKSEKSGILDYNESNKSAIILFDNVHFSYGENKVLDGIGFRVDNGSKMAIVGPTGCGKSTLIHLLLRFYDPIEGFISVKGQKVMDMQAVEIRSMISVVDQTTYLFNDTLRNNLRIASADADDHELLKAIQLAQLDRWFYGLPDGLDTFIGEHGKNVSGAERQRLAIARALLKNTGIWLLDEPTANLDTITEKALVKTIRTVTRNKTVLWITHRLVQMDYFDRILVIQQGAITGRGRHHELIRKKCWYSRMIDIQSDFLVEDANIL